MVPAPITATERMGRVAVLEGTSGTLAAARVAKKTWRNALDAVAPRSSANPARLHLDALIERLQHRRLDAVDNLGGGRVVLRQRRYRAAREIEERLGVRQHGRDVTRLLEGQIAAGRCRNERNGAGHDIAVNHPIEQRRRRELACGHRIAADDHVERTLRPDQARQTLCPTGAG